MAELRRRTHTAISAELAAPPLGLAATPGVRDLTVDGTSVRFTVDGEGLEQALRQLASAGVRSLTSQPPSLEQLFLHHYTGGAHEQEVAQHEIV
jgi:ABC-2 type transport system ATP-binding protein